MDGEFFFLNPDIFHKLSVDQEEHDAPPVAPKLPNDLLEEEEGEEEEEPIEKKSTLHVIKRVSPARKLAPRKYDTRSRYQYTSPKLKRKTSSSPSPSPRAKKNVKSSPSSPLHKRLLKSPQKVKRNSPRISKMGKSPRKKKKKNSPKVKKVVVSKKNQVRSPYEQKLVTRGVRKMAYLPFDTVSPTSSPDKKKKFRKRFPPSKETMKKIATDIRKFKLVSACRTITDLLRIDSVVFLNEYELSVYGSMLDYLSKIDEKSRLTYFDVSVANSLLSSCTDYERMLFTTTTPLSASNYFVVKYIKEFTNTAIVTRERLMEMFCLGYFEGSLQNYFREGPGLVINTKSTKMGINNVRVLASADFHFNTPSYSSVEVRYHRPQKQHEMIVDVEIRWDGRKYSKVRLTGRNKFVFSDGLVKDLKKRKEKNNLKEQSGDDYEILTLENVELNGFPNEFYHFFDVETKTGRLKMFQHFIKQRNKVMINAFLNHVGADFINQKIVKFGSKSELLLSIPLAFYVLETMDYEFIRFFFRKRALRRCHKIVDSGKKIPMSIYCFELFDEKIQNEKRILEFLLSVPNVFKINEFVENAKKERTYAIEILIRKNQISLIKKTIRSRQLNHYHMNDIKIFYEEGEEKGICNNSSAKYVRSNRGLVAFKYLEYFPPEYQKVVAMTMYIIRAFAKNRFVINMSDLIVGIFQFVDFMSFPYITSRSVGILVGKSRSKSKSKKKKKQFVRLWDRPSFFHKNEKVYDPVVQNIKKSSFEIFSPDYELEFKELVENMPNNKKQLTSFPSQQRSLDTQNSTDNFYLLDMVYALKKRIYRHGVSNAIEFSMDVILDNIKDERSKIRWREGRELINRENVYYQREPMDIDWFSPRNTLKYYSVGKNKDIESFKVVVTKFILFVKNL